MCSIHYPYYKCCFLRLGWSLTNFHLEKMLKIYQIFGFTKQGGLSEYDLLWGWLICVGESIEPGELTDRGRDDKFISFACSFCCCCSCENWNSIWVTDRCPIWPVYYRFFIKNHYNLHGLTGVNHLEYNLPLTRGAYHTDLGSKNNCYTKLHILYNQSVI